MQLNLSEKKTRSNQKQWN